MGPNWEPLLILFETWVNKGNERWHKKGKKYMKTKDCTGNIKNKEKARATEGNAKTSLRSIKVNTGTTFVNK